MSHIMQKLVIGGVGSVQSGFTTKNLDEGKICFSFLSFDFLSLNSFTSPFLCLTSFSAGALGTYTEGVEASEPILSNHLSLSEPHGSGLILSSVQPYTMQQKVG